MNDDAFNILLRPASVFDKFSFKIRLCDLFFKTKCIIAALGLTYRNKLVKNLTKYHDILAHATTMEDYTLSDCGVTQTVATAKIKLKRLTFEKFRIRTLLVKLRLLPLLTDKFNLNRKSDTFTQF